MNTVKTIEKITASMNRIATSRLKAARDKRDNIGEPFLKTNMLFLKDKGMEEALADDENCPAPRSNELLIALTTDRGMCGSANSGIIRNVRSM